MALLEKKELKYILIATVFAFIVMGYIVPNFLPQINTLSPIMMFVIFNLGIVLFLQIFLKSMTLGKKINLRESFGLMLLFTSLDIMIPPLLLSPQGILGDSVILSKSSSDYIVALMLQSTFGLQGFILYLATYIFIPFLLLILSSLLLKNLVKNVG